jgi:hypothetical protein
VLKVLKELKVHQDPKGLLVQLQEHKGFQEVKVLKGNKVL